MVTLIHLGARKEALVKQKKNQRRSMMTSSPVPCPEPKFGRKGKAHSDSQSQGQVRESDWRGEPAGLKPLGWFPKAI